jgi:hypothetical protein
VTAPLSAKRVLLGAGLLGLGLVGVQATSDASIFGEENILLGELVSQSVKSYDELRQISDVIGAGVQASEELVDTVQRVHAGIDELAGYSGQAFLRDFKGDLTHLYPGLGKLSEGSARLADWDRTHTQSPFTAYEAVSAVFGDLTKGAREDARAGRRNVDRELVLRAEAAGGFALASVSEGSTEAYDKEVVRLRDRYERRADPGTAAMVAAHANLVVAEQNSHIIRLLARTVRLDGVEKTLRAAERIGAVNDDADRRVATATFMGDALRAPRLVHFEAPAW